jgi:TonB family protein
MSQAAPSIPGSGQAQRRRSQRYALSAPVDVVVLRSGIPSTIPGRSLDLGEGGVAAILAGELRPGESVGIEIKLPFGMEAVQAKALVRDQQQLCCRLQFLGMRPESRTALRTWTQMSAAAKPKSSEVPQLAAPDKAASPEPSLPLRRRRQSRKAKWMALSPLLFVLTLVIWWWAWQNGWIASEAATTTAQASSQTRVLNVPSSVMEHSLLHRVEPTYPDEALEKKTEGLVVVNATIGTDGAVKQVHPLSGPDNLAQAAVNAVRWWRFQPYQVDGHPTEVQTTIEVDFRLHE